MARATMADPDIVAKTRAGAEERVRPCIGLNECIHRRLVEGLVYACGVSPRFAREAEPPPPPPAATRSVLVVGGGPAGTELAALCAERGHDVELWERDRHLGGALARGRPGPGQPPLPGLDRLPGPSACRPPASASSSGERPPREDVLAAAVDVVAVATGASPRRPDVPGCDLPHVVTIAEALTGTVDARTGRRRGRRGRRTCAPVGRRPPRRPRTPRDARLPERRPRAAGRQVLGGCDVRPPGRRRRDARAPGPSRRR